MFFSPSSDGNPRRLDLCPFSGSADLTDRALFAVDVDAAKLASRLRVGQSRAKTAAGLSEAGGAFYDAALDRCCQLYVRAVVQVPAFVGRSSAEILSRLSGLPDQVAARVVDAWREAQAEVPDPDGGVTVAGRPLEEVTDPFVLEVHRPVQPEGTPTGLPELPTYVPRGHDQVLAQVVQAAAGGLSGIAVLVGGSSTGKTRACWEALQLLRDQDPPWRLWHPIDPSRPDAALRELPGIGPRTVVWLNEAQFYLDPPEAGLGEKVAAGLRELLRDPGQAPVLMLATLWPGFWATAGTGRSCPAPRASSSIQGWSDSLSLFILGRSGRPSCGGVADLWPGEVMGRCSRLQIALVARSPRRIRIVVRRQARCYVRCACRALFRRCR
jgi:hypothetical protein